MRVKRLSLRPFAGFLKREVEFSPGLNILLGPNDVGKSTIFRALDSAFFLPSRVSKSTREGKELIRILPYGSDRAALSLELTAKGQEYKLEKIWGQGAGASLEGPNGLRASDDEKVEAALKPLLPVPAATYQNVLFMGQGALEGTVQALEEKKESLHSLSDFLRLAVNQSTGLSVDGFKHKLTEKIEAAFSYWDRKLHLPEKGRGIENKWQKNVGSVLAAYYVKEEAKRDFANAASLEAARDQKLQSLGLREEKRERARAFVRENQALVEGSGRRLALEAKIGKAKLESDHIVKDIDSWMQAESDRRASEPEVKRLESKRAELEAELKRGLAFAKKREVLSRFEKAKGAAAKVEGEKQKLANLPALSGDDLKRLRAAQLEVDGLKTGLRAGKMQLQFTVKKEMELTVKKDLDPERSGKMSPGGKPMTVSAGGRIQLSSDYFDLTLTSGEGKVNELEEQLGRKSDFLGSLYAQLKVKTFEEAQERHDQYLAAFQCVRGAEAELQGALGVGEKFADLEKLAASLGGDLGLIREPELVQAELQSLLKDLGGKNEAFVKAESLIRDLVRRHGVEDRPSLMKQMIKKQAELESLEAELAGLPPLPSGVENFGALERQYRENAAEVAAAGEEIQRLSIELAEIKAKLPEQSAEDLARISQEAEAAFAREKKRAEALLRVEEAVKKVESEAGDIFSGFRASFAEKIGKLSHGKYQKARMAESLPSIFERQDGAAIPYGWLSAGTKDAFALALRLAMASHFLGQDDGFLMIDDPLVNMDPARQKIAAEMLREFAQEKQVLVFTCHPSHAELLGGNVIEI